MKKEAILHIPLSQYAYAVKDNELVIRIRTAKNDLRQCVLFYGDRADQEKKIRTFPVEMKKAGSDDLFDYYEAVLKKCYSRVCYYFMLDDGNEKIFYYERGFCRTIECDRTEYFQFPYIRREDVINIPEWSHKIIMYHIFPDSFADEKRTLTQSGRKIIKNEDGSISENHLGGTITGVIDNLDYLENLGINCVYLNPIFMANSYHKYDTIDYFKIDPCLGTLEDVKKLVNECHKRGIYILLDGVFNHCGADFFAFRDVRKKGKQSQYYDWFYEMKETVDFNDPPNYAAFAYVKEMPKLNTGNPEVEEYLLNVAAYWTKELGIDGWRLDVANEINHDFWRKFRKRIREINPDSFFIGEIWEDAQCWLMGDQFDSTMNYRFSYLCCDFFARRTLNATQFGEQIIKMLYRYPMPVAQAQMNFLDSHDVPRFLSLCNGDVKRLELAMFYLLMSCGIPSIFYGDEYLIDGVEECEYRKAMPWGKMTNIVEKIAAWTDLRKNHPALYEGNYLNGPVDDEKGIYSFFRKNDKESLWIIINNSDKAYTINDKFSQYGHGETIEAMQGKVFVMDSLICRK